MSNYTVEAILKARDAGFSGIFKNAEKSVTGLTSMASKVGSTFKSVLGANIIGSAITSGIGVVSNQIGGLVGDINASSKAWQTFQANMENLQLPKNEIAGVKKELQSFATETIYSASDMAQTYSQLAAVGIKGTKELVTGFGGLAAAAENPAQAMKTLSTQAVQMAAKPNVAWADFKLMLEQTPAGIAAVAKHMGMSTAEMVAAVQDGKIATQDFFDAINAVGNNDTFRKMATEYKSVDQAIDGLTEGISNKLLPAFEVLSKYGIKAVEAIINIVDKFDGEGFASQIDKWAQSFQGMMKGFSDLGVFDNFKATLASIGEMFRSIFKIDPAILNTGVVTVANILNGLMYVIQDVAAGVSSFFEGFTNSGAVRSLALAFFDLSQAGLDLSEKLSGAIPWETIGNAVGQVVKFIADVISVMAQLSQKIDGNIFRGLLIGIPAAIAGLKAFNFLKSFNPFGFFTKNATSGMSGATSVVKSAGTSVVSIIRSLGQSVATAARGIGQGIGAAFRGIGQGLSMVNPVTIAALAVPILALGVAFAIMGMQGQGIATILQGVGSVIVSVGTAIGSILNQAIQGLAQALVIVAPVLPTITSAFAQLSPLITAAGEAIATVVSAFSSLSPVITALGTALSQVITALSSGVAQIITAVTPIVEIIGNVFTTVVQIVADAIVQIVQALAPFIPSITQMVQALAPVLQSMVQAFTTLVSQISPIIDSISNLFRTLGEQITSILGGVSSVIESFGTAIRNVLDGVAGIFESMGTAARNAGQGVKLMAQGIKMLVDLNLGDLVGTLAAVATGLTAIASAGPGLQQAGSSLSLIAVSAHMVVSSFAGIASIASVASSAMAQFNAAVHSAMTQAVSTMRSSMTQMVSVVRQSASQMTQAGQQAGRGVSNGVTNGIRSGIGSVTAAMTVMVNAIRSTAMAGAGSMRVVGAMIGQGLAQGMHSALGAVTAAANALVAQAERAARAKAKIHSPARLFRDRVGIFIGQGVAVGIDKSQKFVDRAMVSMFDGINSFNNQVNDLMGSGLVYSFDAGRHSGSVEVVYRKQDDGQLGIIKEALSTIKDLVSRDVVLEIDGSEFARTTGDQMTEYQIDKQQLDYLMRGIR